MNRKISVVIRNKNESQSLNWVLNILNTLYSEYLKEIIIVDNYSTDDSLKIADKFNCKIVMIKNFTYGKAINIGIENAKSNYILLLSSHAFPIGDHFFYNALTALKKERNIAGIRFINSFDNYKRAFKNNFIVNEPLKFGLMAGCCIVNKEVWKDFKFNENLSFSEDKEWSQRVSNAGYKILDLNETFFYAIKRTDQDLINRYKNETLSSYQLHKKQYPSIVRIVLSFLKKIVLTNIKFYFKSVKNDYFIFLTKVKIYLILKANKNE
ncbi:glycosyltransferase [Winogradskyella sp. PAMC22761]|nr:glycosyltransferase [Winogradskyella sp. PAMC22761]